MTGGSFSSEFDGSIVQRRDEMSNSPLSFSKSLGMSTESFGNQGIKVGLFF